MNKFRSVSYAVFCFIFLSGCQSIEAVYRFGDIFILGAPRELTWEKRDAPISQVYADSLCKLPCQEDSLKLESCFLIFSRYSTGVMPFKAS